MSPNELEEKIDVQELAMKAAQLIEERKANMRPTRCSHCLGNSERPLFVQQKGEPEVLLCTLRCLALWAISRGWPLT